MVLLIIDWNTMDAPANSKCSNEHGKQFRNAKVHCILKQLGVSKIYFYQQISRRSNKTTIPIIINFFVLERRAIMFISSGLLQHPVTEQPQPALGPFSRMDSPSIFQRTIKQQSNKEVYCQEFLPDQLNWQFIRSNDNTTDHIAHQHKNRSNKAVSTKVPRILSPLNIATILGTMERQQHRKSNIFTTTTMEVVIIAAMVSPKNSTKL